MELIAAREFNDKIHTRLLTSFVFRPKHFRRTFYPNPATVRFHRHFAKGKAEANSGLTHYSGFCFDLKKLAMTLERKRNYKRNDTGPPLRASVQNKSDDSPLDLTGASIRFHMMDQAGVLQVDDDALIESPEAGGLFRYEWSPGDLDTIGVFDAEFEIEA